MHIDQKSLETEFSIAICHPIGDKWQSKILFLAILVPRLSIVKRVFDRCLPGMFMLTDQTAVTVVYSAILGKVPG